jgi:hypothetical protein
VNIKRKLYRVRLEHLFSKWVEHERCDGVMVTVLQLTVQRQRLVDWWELEVLNGSGWLDGGI